MTPTATLSLQQAVSRDWDAAIVGAGPAGSLAARELARAGLRVLLVDRSAFPRGKVCGCCLNVRALNTLAAVGLGDLPASCGAVPIGSILLAAGRASARVRLPGGMALSREAFDAALICSAIAAGADFMPETRAALDVARSGDGATTGSGDLATTVERRPLWLHQRHGEAQVSARVVLAADGLGGKLLARAGLGQAPAVVGARLGAGATIAADEPWYSPGTIYMSCGRPGYVGLVRLEDGRLDLAAALDASAVRAGGGPGAIAAQLLREVGWPEPSGLAEAPWRGTAALTRQAVRLSAPRLFVLGDAAGYVEPFTGEGMAWALASAVALAPLVVRASERWAPELEAEWRALHREVVGRRQLACRTASAVLRRPLLTCALVHVLARLPALAGPFVRSLNRTVTRT